MIGVALRKKFRHVWNRRRRLMNVDHTTAEIEDHDHCGIILSLFLKKFFNTYHSYAVSSDPLSGTVQKYTIPHRKFSVPNESNLSQVLREANPNGRRNSLLRGRDNVGSGVSSLQR